MRELTVQRHQQMCPALLPLILSSECVPKLVRIEGVMGIGKPPLARDLAGALNGLHIEADFALRTGRRVGYAEAMDQPRLHAAVEHALQTGQWVVVDGVCLEEVLPSPVFGAGFLIYLKRDGEAYQQVGEGVRPPRDALRRSIHRYHQQYAPHERADVVCLNRFNDFDIGR